MRLVCSAYMRASRTFTIFIFLLLGLAKITGMRELLSAVADDRVVTIIGGIALVLVASALTIWTLRLQRGWSPE